MRIKVQKWMPLLLTLYIYLYYNLPRGAQGHAFDQVVIPFRSIGNAWFKEATSNLSGPCQPLFIAHPH